MPTESGYSNQKKLGLSQFKTVNSTGSGQFGTPIIQKTLFDLVPAPISIVSVTDIIGANGQVEFWKLEITAHSASKLDVVRFISGSLTAFEFDIIQVIDANNVYILPISDVKPIAADTVKTLRWTTSKSDQEGNLTVVVTPSPTSYIQDSVSTNVNLDTATPANSLGLPVNQLNGDGTKFDPSVQAADISAIKSDIALIEAKDFATETTLASILADTTSLDGKDFATEVTLASILADTTSLDGKDFATEVTLASILADTTSLDGKDFATETTLASILADTTSLDGKDFATETTLAALLTELELKADLADTQPVSLASIPLASGAATGANQVFAPVSLSLHNFASTNVSNAAYVEIVASTAATRKIQVFMSSGEPLYLAFGAVASEVDKIFIIPGGNGLIDLLIPAATRLSIKAVNAVTVNTGVLLINYLG